LSDRVYAARVSANTTSRQAATDQLPDADPTQDLVLRVVKGAGTLLRTVADQPGADIHGSPSVLAVQAFATSMCHVASHLAEADQSSRALFAAEMTGLPETRVQPLGQHSSSVRQARSALEASIRVGESLRAAYCNNKKLADAISRLLRLSHELSAALTALAIDG
jgi:hypothetical protein